MRKKYGFGISTSAMAALALLGCGVSSSKIEGTYLSKDGKYSLVIRDNKTYELSGTSRTVLSSGGWDSEKIEGSDVVVLNGCAFDVTKGQYRAPGFQILTIEQRWYGTYLDTTPDFSYFKKKSD